MCGASSVCLTLFFSVLLFLLSLGDFCVLLFSSVLLISFHSVIVVLYSSLLLRFSLLLSSGCCFQFQWQWSHSSILDLHGTERGYDLITITPLKRSLEPFIIFFLFETHTYTRGVFALPQDNSLSSVSSYLHYPSLRCKTAVCGSFHCVYDYIREPG